MMDEWVNFWAKYLSVFLLTVFFTFLGVLGKYLRTIKKNKEAFNLKALAVEFLIALTLTFLLALACISNGIDTLTTYILVGIGGHFGTNGILKLICRYIKLDCGDLVEEKEVKDV